MRNAAFFRTEQEINRFEDSHNLELYTALPDDWSVAVFDVIGSTQAIENNRYKDVNAVGVCCITAALNALDTEEVPYVFGGDGATMLIPNEARNEIVNVMLGLQTLTEHEFGLKLRTGIVPMTEIRRHGQQVLVGRLRLSSTKSVALLAGGGAQLADKLIKDTNIGSQYRVCASTDETQMTPAAANTQGFSCRWQPMRAHHGYILTGLVQAQNANDMTTYAQIIELLCRQIGDPRNRNPAKSSAMRLSGRWSNYEREAKLAVSQGRFKTRLHAQAYAFFGTQLGRLFTWLGRTFGSYDGNRYTAILIEQTDHLRFDDMLRFVLDVSATEYTAIIDGLENFYKSGKIFYGTQRSDTAIMTCMVNDYDRDHVHFLDGGNGGFTMAAKVLKAQLKTASR